ncbi:MAG: Ig-like domain-containing protein [Sphaerochaeta sp.]
MKYFVLGMLLAIQLCISCGCEHDMPSPIDLFGSIDSTPPTLVAIKTNDRYTSLLVFDEAIQEDSLHLSAEGNRIEHMQVNNKTLTFTLKDALIFGEWLPLTGRVEDLRGNSVSFSVFLWAENQNPPKLLINEFSTKGSESNPDRVELLVLERGNIGGITLYAGTEQSYRDRLIFEERWVERGEYLVVAFSKGDVKEGTYHAEAQAGLSGNNGCLSLALSPQWDAPLLDAAVWGNHTTQTHEGFGSKELLEQVAYIHTQLHWNSKKAEESIDSTNSTATRSISRDHAKDTNSKDDWYVCATRGASFGGKNSEDHYQE